MNTKGKILEEYPEIIDFELLKPSLGLRIIFIVLSILSFGVFAIIIYWHKGLRNSMYHRAKNIKEARKVVFITNQNQHVYCTIRSQQGKLFKEDSPRQLITVKIDMHIYYFDEASNSFSNIGNEFLKTVKGWLEKNKQKLEKYAPQTADEAAELLRFFGPNRILLPVPSAWLRSLEITFLPINVYQLTLSFLFFYFRNYVWSLHLIAYIGIQIFLEIRDERSNIESINSLSQNRQKATVLRSRPEGGMAEQEIEDSDLVVGDIIRVSNGQPINCDALVIHGACLVNQAVLTGESVPVAKESVRQPAGFLERPFETNFLFSGSECIIIRTPAVWALVVGTGWNTFKGSLLGQIAKEKVKSFKYDRDFYLVCFIMAGVYTLLIIGIAVRDHHLSRFSWSIEILRWVRVLNFAIQPSLFLAISIAVFIVKWRLREKGVIIKKGRKLKEAGRVKVICFDKTGTLTEENVEICGFLLKSGPGEFGSFAEEIGEEEPASNKKEAAECVALCNNLHFIDGRMLGDPMDLEMFGKSGFKVISHYTLEAPDQLPKPDRRGTEQPGSLRVIDLKEGHQRRQFASERFVESPSSNFYSYIHAKQALGLSVLKEDRRNAFKTLLQPSEDISKKAGLNPAYLYKVHHIFDFTPERKRLSVIASRPKEGQDSQREFLLFTKGAPETIKKLSRSESLPKGVDQRIVEFSGKGYRLIAVAFKPISDEEVDFSDEQLEKDLTFLGFVVLHNQQKPKTFEVISALKANLIRCLIITGDSVFTGVNVALGTGIISKSSRIFIGEGNQGGRIRWTELSESDSGSKLKGSVMSEGPPLSVSVAPKEIAASFHAQHVGKSLKHLIRDFEGEECVLAVEGDAFDHLLKKYADDKVVLKKLFEKIAVYGRAKPDQKERVVTCLREHYEPRNITIGFVGDGSNDCKALNTAHMGLSIGNSEASIAGAYSSFQQDIAPVLDLLIEGRFTLENLHQLFKVSNYAAYTKSVSLVFTYYLAQLETSYDFLLNIVYFLPVYVLISMSDTSGRLNPLMPKAGVLDKTSIVQFLVLLFVGTVYLTLVFFILILRPEFKNTRKIMENPMTTELDSFFFIDSKFLVLAFVVSYFIIALVLHRGFPFKKPFYQNYWLMGFVGLSLFVFYFPLFIEYVGNYQLEKFVNYYLRNPQFDVGLKIKAFVIPAVYTLFCGLLIKIIDNQILINAVKKVRKTKELELKL